MADRYFVDVPIVASTALLGGGEAHHLAHVMRAKPGAVVTLFDGGGAEFSARVERVGRSEVELAILERREVDRELAAPVTLAVALPKGDRQRWLAEKATELGAARLIPLVTVRGNGRESPAAIEKLRRAVIEASKQCGRNRLLEIAAPVTALDFFRGDDLAPHKWLAHPGGVPLAQTLDPVLAGETNRPFAFAVGPEGGFTAEEIAAAEETGWRCVGLGAAILRVETAALALLAATAARLAPRS